MYKVVAVQPASTDAWGSKGKCSSLELWHLPFQFLVSTLVDMAGLSTDQHSNTWAGKVQMRLNLECAVAVLFVGEPILSVRFGRDQTPN